MLIKYLLNLLKRQTWWRGWRILFISKITAFVPAGNYKNEKWVNSIQLKNKLYLFDLRSSSLCVSGNQQSHDKNAVTFSRLCSKCSCLCFFCSGCRIGRKGSSKRKMLVSWRHHRLWFFSSNMFGTVLTSLFFCFTQTSNAELSSSRTLRCLQCAPPSKCPGMVSSSWQRVRRDLRVCCFRIPSCNLLHVTSGKLRCSFNAFQALTNPEFAATTPISCPWNLSVAWIQIVSLQTHPLVALPPPCAWLNLMIFFPPSQSCGLWHPVGRLL